jgi:hypothetical protein
MCIAFLHVLKREICIKESNMHEQTIKVSCVHAGRGAPPRRRTRVGPARYDALAG